MLLSSQKRHKGPLTERQREARAEQQQQRRGVSTYTNLDASQAPWASETQDEEEPPVQLGAAGKSESVFGGEEARTGFEGFPTVTGVSGEALVGGGEMVTRNGGEGVLMENGHGTTALQGEVIEKAKEGDDEMEIEWQESKVAGASEDMPTGDKGSFFGAGGVSDRGGSTDPRGERQGSEKVEDAKVEESAVGKEEVERPEETDGAPKADVKATAGPSERSEGSPKKDEAGGVQPKAPARVEMGVCGDNDGGCAVMVAAQTLEQEPANRGEDEVPVRGSENRTMERSSPERKEEERSSAAAQAPKAEAPQLTRRGSEGSIPECRPVESTTFLSASTKATVGSPFVPERPEGGVGDGSVEAGLPTGGLPGVNALLNRENAAADGTVPASGPERSDTLPLPETQEGSRDEVRQLERAVDSACEAGDGGLKASDLYPGEKSLVASGGVVLNAADGKALETGAELTATKERADADTPAAETAPKSQPRVSQNPLSNPAVSAQAEQPALEAAAAAVPSDAQTLIHREFPTNVLSALPIANPTPKATLNPVSEQPLDPVPASAPDPTANPTANAAQEEGPNSNRAVNPAPEPMVKQNLNPASEPAVSGPVFPELVSSDAPVKNVLSNLPRSARQVLLAGAVCTVGDLAKMDCGELRKRMPIRGTQSLQSGFARGRPSSVTGGHLCLA